MEYLLNAQKRLHHISKVGLKQYTKSKNVLLTLYHFKIYKKTDRSDIIPAGPEGTAFTN